MKKRILALLLALAMVMTLVPAALAEETVAEETPAAAATETVEPAAEPAAPAETTAEPAATEETQQTAEPAAQTDAKSDAQTDAQTDAQADAQADAEPVYEVEEPLGDVTRVTDCVCGGWHNGEYGHVCEAVEWTSITTSNVTSYWKAAKLTGTNNLRLTADITRGTNLQVGEGETVNIDLNGHTFTVSAGRWINLYQQGTLNVCDSSAAQTGRVVLTQTTAPGDAKLIAMYKASAVATTATAENPSRLNLWGGTFTTEQTGGVPAILSNRAYEYISIYSGVVINGFTNNNSTTTNAKKGGAINQQNSGGVINFYGGTISNCSATNATNGYGGAIYMHNGTLNMYDGAVIDGCSSANLGGGIYKNAGTLNFYGGTISNCTSTKQGAGIYNVAGNMTFSGGSITGCAASTNGGAFRSAAGTITLSGVTISNCTSVNSGAGVYVTSGTLEINEGTLIDGCVVPSGYNAGGVYFTNGTFNMNGGTISNCQAGAGGGIGLYQASGGKIVFNMNGGTITGCRADGKFESNGTSPSSYGGAIYWSLGGGSWNAENEMNLLGGTISDNYASAGGGALRIQYPGVTLNGTTITGNSCTNDGGAIYMTGTGVLNFIGGTITDNHSTGTTSGFQASGIGMRSGTTLNISGEAKLYGNVGTGSNHTAIDIDYASSGTRTINISDLTGDGYVILTDDGLESKLALTDTTTSATTKHASGGKTAYFGADYTTDTGVNDVVLTLDFHDKTTYTTAELLEFDVYAKIDADSPVDTAYLQSLLTKITTTGTGAVSFTDLDGNVGYSSDDHKISLYMWDDTTITAPVLLTKEPLLLGTIYGTPTTAGNVNITCDAELATTATASPIVLQQSQAITVKEEQTHLHCYCGLPIDTATEFEGHTHLTEAPEWIAVNGSNAADYFCGNGNWYEDGDEIYLYLTSDITVTSHLYIGVASGGTATKTVNIHFDLNGHTISSTAQRVFSPYSGEFTLCDCQGTGSVVIAGGTGTGRAIFFGDVGLTGSTTATIFSGTFINGEALESTTYGMFYINKGNTLNIYGGTFDGNNKATTNSAGGGIITLSNGTVNIYGGTFQNGLSNSEGGAIRLAGATCVLNVKNATFQNNSAANGGAVNAKGTCTFENCTFTGNSATVAGGGLRTSQNAAIVTVTNCAFNNNSAVEGGAVYDVANTTYDTVTFSGNTATTLGANAVFNSTNETEKTVIDTDFGTVAVGAFTVVTLPATTKLQRKAALTGTITMTGANANDVLSADGETTFTADDATHFVLTGGTANQVRCVDGTLVAVTSTPSTIAFNEDSYSKTFDGLPWAFTTDDVTVTGSEGEITFTYYSDSEGETEISAPTTAGDYWAKATVASDMTHDGAATELVAVTINAITGTHTHCICGGDYTVGNHTEHDESIVWQQLGQNNRSTFQKAFTDGANHYFYLVGDLTTTGNTSIGHKTNGAGHVFLCLNGHKLISTGNRQFDMRNGSITICDCEGTGKIIAAPSTSVITTNNGMPSAGTIGFWQQSAYGLPGSEFTAYGVTFENEEGLTNNSSHGFIYATLEANINLYGCTFDGKECQNVAYPSTPNNHGGGLMTAEGASTINIIDCTFQNGRAIAYGGAVSIRGGSTVTIENTTFTNNVAGTAGDNIFINGSAANIDAQLEGVLFTSTASITGDIAADSEIKVNSPLAVVSIGDVEIGAGTVIDLNGCTMNINTSKAVLDVTVKSNGTDSGKIVFGDLMDEEAIEGIVNTIAANGAALDAAERCLPLKTGEKEYTICRLNSSSVYRSKVVATTEADQYKFRMQPRFASQKAYDIMAEASDEDVITIGFNISATYQGDTVQIYDAIHDKLDTSLNCNFSLDNVHEFGAYTMDAASFFVKVSGLDVGYEVTVVPYIMINGQTVYTCTAASEIAILTLT